MGLKMKLSLLAVLSQFVGFGSAFSQQKQGILTLEVKFVYSIQSEQAIPGIGVELKDKNRHLICSGVSDSLGKIFFDTTCIDPNFDTLYLELSYEARDLYFLNKTWVNPFFGKEEIRSFDFFKQYKIPFEDLIDTEKIRTVNALAFTKDSLVFSSDKTLLFLLWRYPSICVEIKQWIYPEETEELANQRREYFKKCLLESKLSSKNITLSEERVLIERQNSLEGIIPAFEYSLKGFDCE